MKKEFYVLIILFVSCRFVFGQAFTTGITGGISVNQINGDGDIPSGYHMLGATGGAYIQTNLPGKWQIKGEVKYFLKGAAHPPTQDNPIFPKEHLNYIQVPLLVNYYLGERFFPEAGLAAGYLFRAREDMDGNGFLSPSRPFKQFELSFEGGLNFLITKIISANIRLSYSILPIRPNPGNQVFRLRRGEYNSSLSFNLYYRIIPLLAHKN